MRVINFFSTEATPEQQQLVDCHMLGFSYEQTCAIIGTDVYIPRDQYDAFCVVLDAQMNLEIGNRIYEWLPEEERAAKIAAEQEEIDAMEEDFE